MAGDIPPDLPDLPDLPDPPDLPDLPRRHAAAAGPMHHTTTVALAGLAAGIALTGCSSSSGHTHAKPTDSGWFSYSPLSTTAPVTERPVPHTKPATGARTAACWKAIRDQYTPGTVQLTGAPTTPPACAGLSSDEISAVAADVIAHQLG